MRVLEYYRMRSDDHIQKVAVRYYYHYWLWRIILGANKEIIKDPFNIEPGTMLAIVELNTGDVEHTLVAGDTYQSIAEQYYGTNVFFANIMNANSSKLLEVGDTVAVPPLVTQRELKLAEAIRNAVA